MPSQLEYERALDALFPSWRRNPPPGSVFDRVEGEQAFATGSPAASTTPIVIASWKIPSTHILLLTAASLQGDRMDEDPVGGHTIPTPMAPAALRNKAHWRVQTLQRNSIIGGSTYTVGRSGTQRFHTYSPESGFLAVAVSPGETVQLQLTVIDPDGGVALPAAGAVLTGYLAGYIMPVAPLQRWFKEAK